jgi:hypothetical protein
LELNLTGRVAFVAGSSRGIGKAIAAGFLAEGCRTVISGRDAQALEATRAEWAAYGDRVGSVHIKDRIRGGGTVPLGTGDADFPGLFTALREAGYDGPWVLQVARGTSGDEVTWARRNRAFLLNYLERRS